MGYRDDARLSLKTILLAENEESTIALYEAMLAPRDDWRMVVARTGDEAIELAGREAPDLALVDIEMPTMDGIKVCRRLKANPDTAAVPVIVVTAFAQQANRQAAAEAGADDFIAKPFSTTELTELVERTLAGRDVIP
jgi:CheY-like chemotaxis protein